MPANNASLRAAALNRVGIRDPNVPPGPGTDPVDQWPNGGLYDTSYGRFIPPYTRGGPEDRGAMINDVYNKYLAEIAADTQRRDLRRMLKWRHEIGPNPEYPGAIVWQGGPPGAGMDEVPIYPDSPVSGVPTNTGIFDEREAALNQWMQNANYPVPADPEFYPEQYYPTTGQENLALGLQRPADNPPFVPPGNPTPPTPSEVAGRGPNTGPIPATPQNTQVPSRPSPHAREYFDKIYPTIQGGVDTFNAGFAPPISSTSPGKASWWAGPFRPEAQAKIDANFNAKPQYDKNTPEPRKNTGIMKLLFGSGPAAREPEKKPPKGRGIPTQATWDRLAPKPEGLSYKPTENRLGTFSMGNSNEGLTNMIFGRRQQLQKPPAPKPSPSPTRQKTELTPSSRNYPSSSTRNVAPKRPTPKLTYRPPQRNIVQEPPAYVPPPPPPVYTNPAPVNPNYGKGQAPIRRSGGY